MQPEAAAPEAAPPAPAEAPPPAAPGPRLPTLLEPPAPAWPAGALEAGSPGATVPLELGLDENGVVIAVSVVAPVGGGFDEAATLAARALRFSPAVDAQGEPAPAVIRFNMRFSREALPVKVIEGTLREGGTRQILGGVVIEALGPEGRRAFAETDDQGRYSFVGLAPGPWQLEVKTEPYEPRTQAVTVKNGVVVGVDLYLVRDDRRVAVTAAESIEVVDTRGAGAELVERRLTAEEIKYLPGSGGDVVKAVQNLPGIARSPLGTGQLIIRGTAPEDSRFFLDGSPIPLVFHFAGLTAVLNNDLIEEVRYLPGSFSVRYGRMIGGAVDIETKARLPERSNGAVSVDVYQSTFFVQQRINDRTAISASGRRSYIDAVLSPLLSEGDLTVQAPRYYDAQVQVLHEGKDNAFYDVLLFLSDDEFRFLGADEDDVLVSFADSFTRGRVRRLGRPGDGWQHESTVAFGPELREFQAGDISSGREERLLVSVRDELSRGLSPDRPLGGRVGVDLLAGKESFSFDEARLNEPEAGEALQLAPALYGELTWRIGRLQLTPGLRTDGLLYDNGYTGWSIDPRVNARYVLGSSTVLKAAAGRYSGTPTLRQVAPESDGNDQLTFPSAIQTSFGFAQPLWGRVNLEVTGFYNELSSLVVGREDRLRFFTGPPPVGPFDTDPYANDGVGLVCGVEGLVRYTGPSSVGLLSVTGSHSQRKDRPDEPTELFASDQPLIINALWSQKLRRNWRLGGRVRHSSGNPYTPVVNRVYDMESRSFQPVYGERSSERIPAFTSIDIRIDKTYTFEKWKLETYLDIQNATFSQNIEVIGWTYDYAALDPVLSNPPLPVFGFKGTW
ncbi:MAG: TonB-dependent receptor [Deltaproteobacteria bacterium]|nr:TonB-dependent receptor [Deltaproteobacteria bacterium]